MHGTNTFHIPQILVQLVRRSCHFCGDMPFFYFVLTSYLFNFTPLALYRATGGELFRVIAVDPLPEDKAREVVWQLLQGVNHLHSLNIVHMDLKASLSWAKLVTEQLGWVFAVYVFIFVTALVIVMSR